MATTIVRDPDVRPSRTGRRPLLAAGNSHGDVPMLHVTQLPHKPSLRVLVLHDEGWTVVSVKHDWAAVA